jgi:hypothetical protein
MSLGLASRRRPGRRLHSVATAAGRTRVRVTTATHSTACSLRGQMRRPQATANQSSGATVFLDA